MAALPLPPPPPPPQEDLVQRLRPLLRPKDEEQAAANRSRSRSPERRGRAQSWSDAERSEEDHGYRSEHDEETAEEHLLRKDQEWFVEIGVNCTVADIAPIFEKLEAWGWDKFARIVEKKNALFFKDYPPWGLDMQGQPVCSERKLLLVEQDDKIDEEAERYVLPDGSWDMGRLDEEALNSLKDEYPLNKNVQYFVSTLPPSRRGLWLDRLAMI